MQEKNLRASLIGQIRRKRAGSGPGNLIISICCLLVLIIVSLTSLHFAKVLEVKRGINQMGRNAILLLETQGELTSGQESELRNELSQHFSDYRLTYNGNNQKKAYGSPVSIKIEVNATREELGLTKVYDFIQDVYEFKTEYSSTSKAKV